MTLRVRLRLRLLLKLLLRSLPLLGLLDPLRLLPLRRSDRGVRVRDRGVRDLERLGERDRGDTVRRGDRAGESRAGIGLLERLLDLVGDGDAILDQYDA